MTVQYDGIYNVFVTVLGRYWGKTLGLCGNFNKNPNDDFVKPDKKQTKNAMEFADSWKVDRSCPAPPTVPNPCTNAGSVAKKAKSKCSLLKQQPFAQCHRAVNQDAGFIQNCEYDVCACKNHPVSCLCEEYSAYAMACSMAGVLIKWKHLPLFKDCCKSLYSYLVPDSKAKCLKKDLMKWKVLTK